MLDYQPSGTGETFVNDVSLKGENQLDTINKHVLSQVLRESITML